MSIPAVNWKAYNANKAPWTASKLIPAGGTSVEGRLTVAEYLQLMIGGPDAQACLNVCRAEVPQPCAFTVTWDAFLTFPSGSALAGRGPSGPVPRGLGFAAWTTIGTKPPLAGNGDALGCIIVRWFNDNHDGIVVADMKAGSVDVPSAKRVYLYAAVAGTLGGETGILPLTVLGSIAMTESPRLTRVWCSTPQLQQDFSGGSTFQMLGIPPRARWLNFTCSIKTGTGTVARLAELILDGSGTGNSAGWAHTIQSNQDNLASMDLRKPVSAGIAGYDLLLAATATKAVFRFWWECEV